LIVALMRENGSRGRKGTMTAAEFELLDETETEQVIGWRFHELSKAGYDLDAALLLATHAYVDLHVAVDLVRLGCPTETALRILI